MASSLRDIQNQLQSAVTGDGKSTELAISFIVAGTTGPSAQERIKVYADGWYLRLEESLRDDYPAVARRMSEREWEALIKAYIRAHPSSSYTVAKAGDQFPSFLAEAGPEKSWLPDLALLERSIYQARSVEDTTVWDVADLNSLSLDEAESLRFELQPSVKLIESQWNIDELKTAQDQLPKKEFCHILVSRAEYTPTYERITEPQFAFLKKIEARPLLTELIEKNEGNDWMQWLARFAADGIIRRV